MNIVVHPSGNCGCYWYRKKLVMDSLVSIYKDYNIITSTKVIPVPEFYKDIKHVAIQRQASKQQRDYMINFLRPTMNKYGGWITQDLDDIISQDGIPRYNSGWSGFQGTEIQQSIKDIVNSVDCITVTTDVLRDNLVRVYDVKPSKINIIPNYLPTWWFGSFYDEDKIKARIADRTGRKCRIGFTSSLSHFDVKGVNNYVDDFTGIKDFLLDNVKKYDFTFIGGYPIYMEKHVKDKTVKYVSGYDFLNYPYYLDKHNFDIMIAPLLDNEFNRAKSNIKFLESSALGVPCVCQNLCTYNKYTDILFDDCESLQGQIDELWGNNNYYLDVVKRNWDYIKNGSKEYPEGWFMEKNLYKWKSLLDVPQKTINVQMKR